MKKRGKGEKKRKDKKGMSEVIATLLIILFILALIMIVWVFIANQIKSSKEKVETLNILNLENSRIEKVVGDFENGSQINLTIKRVYSKAEKGVTKSNNTAYEKKSIDIILVLDRSGSMRQSGWILLTSIPPTDINTLTVPNGAYSSSYSFYVPSGTARLAVALNWSKVPGYNGSEGSELAMNLRRPSGTWIANSGNKPDDLGGKVDPPDSIGTPSEYFSGISTKPQYFYIENPQMGTWQVKIYGWNLRPKTSPPATQDVSVSIYLGNSSVLNRSSTVLSSDLVKSASKDFIDTLGNEDYAAIVRFGSYAELTQGLTSDKNSVKNAIDNLGSEGGTAINTGIDTARQHMISSGRSNSLKIITILTDGQNDVGPNPVLVSAQQAKNLNYTIFTIGLTNFVDENMLRTIATKPEYYYYSDFNMLNQIYKDLSEKIINIQQIKTSTVSFIVKFLNKDTSCQREIPSSEIPDLLATKTYYFDVSGCITGITKIEVYAKINGEIGPLIDSVDV